MRIIIVVIFMMNAVFIGAQETYEISLQPMVRDTIANRAFYLSKIIDNRPNKNHIGLVQMGQNNRIVKAIFKEPFTEYFRHIVNLILPYKIDSYPIVAKIHQLQISERTTDFREEGVAEIMIEFILQDEKHPIDTIYKKVVTAAADVTRKHSERIMSAIVQCLEEFNQKISKLDSLGQLEKRILVLDFEDNLKSGFYKTFTDLAIQNPIDSLPYYLTKRSDKMERYETHHPDTGQKITVFGKRHTALSKNLKKHVLSWNNYIYWKSLQELFPIYGLVRENTIYINASLYTNYSYFVRTKLVGEFLYFEDRIKTIKKDVYYGPIGSPLTLGKVGIILDTKNGKLNILTHNHLLKMIKAHPDLLEMYNSSNKKLLARKTILRKLNDKLAKEKRR